MGGAHLYYVVLSERQERRASEKETGSVLQSYVLSMAMALVFVHSLTSIKPAALLTLTCRWRQRAAVSQHHLQKSNQPIKQGII